MQVRRQQLAADTGLEVGEQAIQRRDGVLLVEELVGIREDVTLIFAEAQLLIGNQSRKVITAVIALFQRIIKFLGGANLIFLQQFPNLTLGHTFAEGDADNIGFHIVICQMVHNLVISPFVVEYKGFRKEGSFFFL